MTLLLSVPSFADEEVINDNANVSDYENLNSDISGDSSNITDFSPTSPGYVFTNPTAKVKSLNGDFYTQIRSELQSITEKFYNGLITEDQMANLIQSNISPKLATRDDEVALQLSEQSLSVYYLIAGSPPGVDHTLYYFETNTRESLLFSKYPKNASKTVSAAFVATKESKARYNIKAMEMLLDIRIGQLF
ncbi:hypothetical protein [Priestia koreensis]|uniref:Uncharacterized protein n=1 Tax=Priestia koreensis TaxID=284581 RepID=A0A0M0KXF3_9BACI|nr:hypothetical protein [Priestia koreensis]KOO43078.1 hypothetical protein AMD01_16140 [Priestia koreensis]